MKKRLIMNKQEFQQTIKNMKPPKFFTATTLSEAYKAGFEEAKGNALCNSCFLNEPKKPLVPQFVADWYEEHKDNFEYSIKCLCVHGCEPVRQIDTWFGSDNTRPIETLVKMKLFGYDVEKEKLYFASFRDTHQYLGWNEKRCEWFMSCSPFMSGVKQTQETWEDVGIWNNPAFEIKESGE